tara:strand:+ start:594 stop:1397 length:804 start_codon:yes stop_codon:yes gene_type:complete
LNIVNLDLKMTNLITLAGDGTRFAGKYIFPKPLIFVDGAPMVVSAVRSLPRADKYVFVVKDEHCEQYALEGILRSWFPKSEFIKLHKTTSGQAITAKIGIAESSIEPDDDILISCCDFKVQYDEKYFRLMKKKCDVVVWAALNNPSFCENPKAHSWLNTEGGKVMSVNVKHDIPDTKDNPGIVGTFYFKRAQMLLDALERTILNEDHSNGEYYIDNILNYVPPSLKMRFFEVDQYHCWGTPEELKKYENRILGPSRHIDHPTADNKN